MAQRRGLNSLTRQVTALLSSTSLKSPLRTPIENLLSLTSKSCSSISSHSGSIWPRRLLHARHFSSNYRDDETEKDGDDEEEDDDDDDDDDNEDEMEGDEDINGEEVADLNREYSTEEKEAEAAAIGYQVVGPLQRSERVFKPYEPVYAVVQIGSHQFKVSNGDSIFTERLKFCEVNDKLILNKVLILGSAAQTILGRPIVADAAVHAVVEEHALDAKVIIFKKKRRKNYRRTNGHRQELTKLRITDIQGIEKPETKVEKPETKVETKPKITAVKKKQEKVAVPA